MSILDYLLGKQRKTASVAKERLQIILAHERADRTAPDFLPALQQEIVQVVAKYVTIEEDSVKVKFQRHANYAVVELNIALPEAKKAARG